MASLAHTDLLYLLSQLCIALVFARVFGEIFRRLRQPTVVGEIIGGILLGPTVMGHLFPSTFQELFLSHPNATMSMDGIYFISVVMLLFISGMEIELPMVWKNGKTATIISFTGMIIPLGIGFATGWFGYSFLSGGAEENKLVFSLFMGTAFAITALPVIAKILFDLNLLNSKIGSLIISCAMLTDFVGWNLFSVVLSMMPNTQHHFGQFTLWQTALITILFAIFVLTIFKFLLNRLI
jgi:Kef-type K+ transport system membrane component KefB